jgi:hypothetical protein
MAWAWRQNLAMDQFHAGWEKNYSDNHRKKADGSVAKCCPQRGTLPHRCEARLKTNSKKDSMGMAVIQWGMR